ncbi:hypothetical protein Ntsu_00250 [Nocardia sp. IFM 10818]
MRDLDGSMEVLGASPQTPKEGRGRGLSPRTPLGLRPLNPLRAAPPESLGLRPLNPVRAAPPEPRLGLRPLNPVRAAPPEPR